jgi:hypothetical protein
MEDNGSVAHYDYLDENEVVVFRVTREPGKEFRIWRPDGNGGWIPGIKDKQTEQYLVRLLPYNLPVLSETVEEFIYIVEGEKDADRLNGLGLAATCNPSGAGKWKDEYSKYFKDRNVAILPDNDPCGRDHARAVAASLFSAGAADIRVVLLPGLPEKGDVSDWLEAGGTVSDLQMLVENVRPVTATDIRLDLKTIIPPDTPPRFRLVGADDIIDSPSPSWLTEDFFTLAAFVLLYGEPGSGKSFIALDLALSIQAGITWQAGRRTTKPGTVVYIAAEGVGGLGNRIRAWKIGHSVDSFRNIWFLPTAPQLLDKDEIEGLIDTLCRLPELPVLVIIDTLARTTVGGDENSARDMGEFVAAIDRIRAAFGCTVLVVHHATKEGKFERGSSALRGAADVVIKTSKKGKTEVVITCEKGKDFPEFDPFTVVLRQVEIDGDETSCYLVEGVIQVPNSGTSTKPSGTRKIVDALKTCTNPDGMSCGELQKKSGLTHGTYFRARNYLEDQGIIEGRRDGRQVYIKLVEGKQ